MSGRRDTAGRGHTEMTSRTKLMAVKFLFPAETEWTGCGIVPGWKVRIRPERKGAAATLTFMEGGKWGEDERVGGVLDDAESCAKRRALWSLAIAPMEMKLVADDEGRYLEDDAEMAFPGCDRSFGEKEMRKLLEFHGHRVRELAGCPYGITPDQERWLFPHPTPADNRHSRRWPREDCRIADDRLAMMFVESRRIQFQQAGLCDAATPDTDRLLDYREHICEAMLLNSDRLRELMWESRARLAKLQECPKMYRWATAGGWENIPIVGGRS